MEDVFVAKGVVVAEEGGDAGGLESGYEGFVIAEKGEVMPGEFGLAGADVFDDAGDVVCFEVPEEEVEDG
jgi:hypothetical protein